MKKLQQKQEFDSQKNKDRKFKKDKQRRIIKILKKLRGGDLYTAIEAINAVLTLTGFITTTRTHKAVNIIKDTTIIGAREKALRQIDSGVLLEFLEELSCSATINYMTSVLKDK